MSDVTEIERKKKVILKDYEYTCIYIIYVHKCAMNNDNVCRYM